MAQKSYINASCVISKNAITKNGQPLVQGDADGITGFLAKAYLQLQREYPKFYKMDSLSKLGWLTADILLENENLLARYAAEDVGIVISNRSSSIDVDVKYYETARRIASPALFVYTLPNIMIGEICIRHHIKGENAFFVFPEFNAAFIEQYVNNLINSNNLQACICGWVEFDGQDYKSMLLLVEKSAGSPERKKMSFNVNNINKIYQENNG